MRIWSFPMRYQPTDRPDRGHVGEKWSRYQLRSMQIILQATHGIVSGEPTFSSALRGHFQDYERILLMPHDYIFNRDWYERFDGRSELGDYLSEARKLDSDRAELVELLSSCDPRDFDKLGGRRLTKRLRSAYCGSTCQFPRMSLRDLVEAKRDSRRERTSNRTS